MKKGLIILFVFCSIISSCFIVYSPEDKPQEDSGNGGFIDLESYWIASENKMCTRRDIIKPVVQTIKPIEITNISAKLVGELTTTGGEDCAVWFEWDKNDLDECAGMIATGSVCKDGRSIILKNRHAAEDNQKPRFFKGTNYAFFGVGSTADMCRMGQNERGLAMANFDCPGLINTWKYTSDGSSGSEDNDLRIPLGNYTTVAAAAFWLAKHGFHPGQNLIISSEPGVGAIVAVDSNKHSTITWINNTYAGIANAFYCNGDTDSDGNDIRARAILDDIVNNGTSSEGNNKINWQDTAQRIGKDTNDKEDNVGTFGYVDEISGWSSRASMVAVAGNDNLGDSLFMSWLNFAPTTQVGIFLPIYAGSIGSVNDIPSNFSQDNSGLGIQPYAEVKHSYAGEGCAPDYYQCARVREIQTYANYNENITFIKFDELLETIISSTETSPAEARAKLDQFIVKYLPRALKGYIDNITTYSNITKKQYPQGVGTFYETITGLSPGTIYHVRAWASNSKFSANGTELLFLTKPETPINIQAVSTDQDKIKLSWSVGLGANNTMIERHTKPNWLLGQGVQIYNGTGTSCEDTGLSSGTRYYYQFWSFTTLEGQFQFSLSYSVGTSRTWFDNRAPIIDTIPMTQATENEAYFVIYHCIEHDDDTVTWGLVTNASWLTMVGNNLSGTPGDYDAGPYFVNISCDDNNGSVVYQNFTVTIIPVPDAPMFVSKVQDVKFEEDGYYILNLSGLGIDADGDSITWGFEGVNNSLLEIISLGNHSFIIFGRLNQFGSNQVIIWLKDTSPEHLNTSQVLWINITSVNDRPMPPIIRYDIIDSDPLIPGKQNLTVMFTAEPLDVDMGTVNNYSWDFDNDGIIDSKLTNINTAKYTYLAPGNYTVNLTYTDTGGLSNWNSINITVSAPKPTIEDNDKNSDDGSGFLGLTVPLIPILIVILIIFLIYVITRRMKKKKFQENVKSPDTEKKNQDSK
ncbi:PKD domain-containing protein [[Eubacterium] cellulosolvens]